MTNQLIVNFLNHHPELTYNGIDWTRNEPDYEQNRADLLNAADEINKCIDWLDKYFVSNSVIVNPISSYGLKHYVEKYYKTYISTGSLIAAVKMIDLNHKETPGDPNIYMSFKKEFFDKYKETNHF